MSGELFVPSSETGSRSENLHKFTIPGEPVTKQLLKSLMVDARHDGFPFSAVSAIITRVNPITEEEEILLLRRQNGKRHENKWEFPGGKLSFLENLRRGRGLRSGVKREVREETGLQVESVDTYVHHIDHDYGNEKKLGILTKLLKGRQFIFRVQAEGRVRIKPDEHSQFDWFSREKVREAALIDHTLETLTAIGFM